MDEEEYGRVRAWKRQKYLEYTEGNRMVKWLKKTRKVEGWGGMK